VEAGVLAVCGDCDAAVRERNKRMHEECFGVLVLLELIDNISI
jgi:hypothetical protein